MDPGLARVSQNGETDAEKVKIREASWVEHMARRAAKFLARSDHRPCVLLRYDRLSCGIRESYSMIYATSSTPEGPWVRADQMSRTH